MITYWIFAPWMTNQPLKTIDALQLCIKYLYRNFKNRLPATLWEITDFEIPLQIPHPCFSIFFWEKSPTFVPSIPPEKRGSAKTEPLFIFAKTQYLQGFLTCWSISSKVLQMPYHAGLRPSPSHGQYRESHPDSVPWHALPAPSCRR